MLKSTKCSPGFGGKKIKGLDSHQKDETTNWKAGTFIFQIFNNTSLVSQAMYWMTGITNKSPVWMEIEQALLSPFPLSTIIINLPQSFSLSNPYNFCSLIYVEKIDNLLKVYTLLHLKVPTWGNAFFKYSSHKLM